MSSPYLRPLLAITALALFSSGNACASGDILPQPEQRFTGHTGRTQLDSDPPQFPKPVKAPKGAPNVLLVMLDDAGFGQFSTFGGGTPSPTLDKLASKGLRYNRFNTTALCSPTRASLLTGQDPHAAGFGVIAELGAGYDGYTGILHKDTGTIAEILRHQGYATAMIGKNHNTPPWEASAAGPFDHWPTGMGFDYFYGFNGGETNQFEPILYEGTNLVPPSQDPHYHITTDLADHAISWIHRVKAIDPSRPFFLYVAPGATHAPHQPPKSWIKKFKGRFDMGWDKYREQTFERQKKLGVIPPNATLPVRPKEIPAWDSLQPAQQRLYSHMMEVFAAFGAHVDYEMGRVVKAVQQLPDADNTMIIYIVGDNGASAEGGLEGRSNEVSFFNGVKEHWQDLVKIQDQLGSAKYDNHFPAGWALAMNTPFKWAKQVASYFGGIRNPLIISWPARIKDDGGLRSQFSHVEDITPTILQATGIQAPRVLDGVKQRPMDGISLMYTFDNAKAKGRHHTQVFEMLLNRGLYHDGWFASSMAYLPWATDRSHFDPDSTHWELYNIDQDFTQNHDLAAEYPKKLRQMQDLWWVEAQKTDILPLNWGGVERFNSELMGRPSLAAHRKTFIYHEGLNALPEADAPNIKNKSFTITADVEVPSQANGILFTQGGSAGGWGFYLLHGKLIALHNFLGLKEYRVTSKDPVTAGKHRLTLTFDYDGGGRAKGGKLSLAIDGKAEGNTRVDKTQPFVYSLYEGQDIGSDTGSPISADYRPPFALTGKLDQLKFELR